MPCGAIPRKGKDSVLVLVNNDTERSQTIALAADALQKIWASLKFELTGQSLPKMTSSKDGSLEFTLEPGAAIASPLMPSPQGLAGEEYRRARAQAAWALAALGRTLPSEQIPAFDWRDLARIVNENPAAFLAACSQSRCENRSRPIWNA